MVLAGRGWRSADSVGWGGHLCVLGGGCNFIVEGDSRVALASPVLPKSITLDLVAHRMDIPHGYLDGCARRDRNRAHPWGRLFNMFIEMSQTTHTHFHKRTNTTSRLDRIYSPRLGFDLSAVYG